VIIRLVLLFFAVNVYYDTYGQKDCNLSPLVGEWKIVNAYWGVYTNVDSLKLLSLSHKSDNFLTIEFNNDSTYMFRLAKTKKQRKGYYISDEKKCELILNKNRKRLKNSEKIKSDMIIRNYATGSIAISGSADNR